ncbi:MAG TPA: hypothetical protein VGL13_12630 [Polyangiaceae bacterium]|jgi:hypothetical protein
MRRRIGFGVALIVGALTSCRTAGFKRVFMALDQKGDRQRTTFYTDTTAIYCAGELVSGRADVTVGSTIRAKTLYDPLSDSFVPAPKDVTWIGESAPGKTDDTMVSFQLLKSPSGVGNEDNLPYPAGTFTCELSIDGELEDTVEFSIDFPACPILPPTGGEPCAGWVRPGSACDGAAGLTCSCDPSGAWVCQ